MSRRPESVLVVGILLCGSGIISTFMALYYLPSPGNEVLPTWASSDQVNLYYVTCFVDLACAILTLLCGAFIIKGANWARWLYLATCLVIVAFESIFLNSPNWVAILVWQIVMSIGFVGVLFLPNANTYFTSERRRRW